MASESICLCLTSCKSQHLQRYVLCARISILHGTHIVHPSGKLTLKSASHLEAISKHTHFISVRSITSPSANLPISARLSLPQQLSSSSVLQPSNYPFSFSITEYFPCNASDSSQSSSASSLLPGSSPPYVGHLGASSIMSLELQPLRHALYCSIYPRTELLTPRFPTVLGFFTCIPLAYYWDRSIPGGHCINQNNVAYYGTSPPDILTNFAILLLPIPYLWNLQMQRAKKIAITGIFILGSL